jgi:hypothetical protein
MMPVVPEVPPFRQNVTEPPVIMTVEPLHEIVTPSCVNVADAPPVKIGVGVLGHCSAWALAGTTAKPTTRAVTRRATVSRYFFMLCSYPIQTQRPIITVMNSAQVMSNP